MIKQYEIEHLQNSHISIYSLQTTICLSALLANLLLFYLLSKYTVFHNHMKIIMMHMTMTVIVAVSFLLIRSVLAIYQAFDRTTTVASMENCVESVPKTLCILMFVYPMILVIERAYATRRFWDYENSNISVFFRVVCAFMWIPVIIEIVGSVLTNSSQISECQLLMVDKKTFLQRNIWFIMVLLFSLLYSILFKVLEEHNKESEIDYVAHHYSTISIRFQIRENIKTCRFGSKLNVLLFFTFLSLVFGDHKISSTWNEQSEHDDKWALLRRTALNREYLLLIIPLFSIIYSLYFIAAYSQLYEKAKRAIKQWT